MLDAPIEIDRLEALEVLDSRGSPTVAVTLTTADGTVTHAAVPSGASTGSREAVELRDGEPHRFQGRGVLGAVGSVREAIAEHLCGRRWATLAELDASMRRLDGTANLARLGANAVLGVSMAAARSFAHANGARLHAWLAGHAEAQQRLPVPHFNVVNGGAHARSGLAFQEFMLAPVGAPDVADAVRAGAEIYAALRGRLVEEGQGTGLGDEGGFAPRTSDPAQVLGLLVDAIDAAGYQAGYDGVMLAMDPAANGFFSGGAYQVSGSLLSPDEIVELYAELAQRFPLWSIEDGCAEDDLAGWAALTERLGEDLQLVTDDIACTQSEILRDLASRGIGNAVLVKPNQVGTVSDTMETLATARRLGYAQMVSHRSGETADDFVADLAVGCGCGQLKAGAPARGERVAKYNRLLTIAAGTDHLPFGLAEGGRR